jgi:hypothetical protein
LGHYNPYWKSLWRLRALMRFYFFKKHLEGSEKHAYLCNPLLKNTAEKFFEKQKGKSKKSLKKLKVFLVV